MTRANKELAYYQEKAELAKKIDKMEERRNKKLKVTKNSDSDNHQLHLF